MIKSILKKIFWKLPIGSKLKNKISEKRFERKLEKEKKYDEKNEVKIRDDSELCKAYSEYVLNSYKLKSNEYVPYKNLKQSGDVKIAAYYLTQFHPNKQNADWWGKGTTEWNNVNQAVPQYIGHYQPRKPGELGYYDLRIKEVFERQIQLAQNYGIDIFCFYYYWFDGERLLEKPLNMFLENKDLDMPFFYCWANENWTKRFSGTNSDVLMGITQSVENYKKFIHSILKDFEDSRYYKIDNRPVLSIYRPSNIPDVEQVLKYWNSQINLKFGCDGYFIAVQEKDTDTDWIKVGFDAETEFQPKQIEKYSKDITSSLRTIRKDFSGTIYDYKEMVDNKRYNDYNQNKEKVYRAVMPMWDNSARRNFRGTIFHGSTPELYKTWLKDVIKETCENKNLDDKVVFINAWNEWGEGTYLEPDEFYGYAYLQATSDAKREENVCL